MGRRVVLVSVALLVVLAACESTERLEIRADGSATFSYSVVSQRGDAFFEWYEVDFDEWRDLALDDQTRFIEQMFALESIDELPGELTVDTEDDQVTMTFTNDAPDFEALAELLVDDSFPLAPGNAEITPTGATVQLEADAVANLSVFWRSLFAYSDDVDIFSPAVFDGADRSFPAEQTVELTLPGRIVSHDAHEVDGNTLRWSWTVGEPAQPGISVTWDPTDELEPGFDWWGRDQLIVFGFLALGLLVLVIGGSLGFLGFTRKVEKEGRRVRSGRWPRQ